MAVMTALGALWGICGLFCIYLATKKVADTKTGMLAATIIGVILIAMQAVDVFFYFKYVKVEDMKSSSFSHTVNFLVFNILFTFTLIGILMKGTRIVTTK